MELKFIFSLFVLLHLRICVSGFGVRDCLLYVDLYPEEAEGFAEVDASKKDLKVAIDAITEAKWNNLSRQPGFNITKAEVEDGVAKDLTRCYILRKVKSF